MRIKHGYAFKGEFFSDGGPYIVLTPGNFYDAGGLKLKGDKEKYYIGPFPKDFILKLQDLLVVMTEQAEGLLGSAAFIPENNLYLHNQRLGLITDLKTEKIDKNFLYYLFNSRDVRTQIRASANGTKIRHTSPDRIYQVKIKIPLVKTQQKIAAILSAYDDLIENNTRRIKILEEMAQAIYREWFVHFRFPGHEGVRMVESELGLVPEGWSIKDIQNICAKIQSGGTPSRNNEEYWITGTIEWYKTKELQDGFLIDSEEKITEKGLKNSSAKIFPEDTIIIALYASPTLGRMGILTKSATFNQATCALIPNPNCMSMQFLFFLLLNSRDYFRRIAQGAAQQNINVLKLKETPIVLPPKAIVDSFTTIVTPVFENIKILTVKNKNLRRSRDLLLPKLISGEIDVSDMGIKIPEAEA